MVANKIFEDPRNVNFVFCYTDTELPADSIVTINGTPAYISSIYTAQDGWQPGVTSSNQGVIGFNYLGSGFTYGDTFNITNSSYTFSVSGYAPGPSYGYLNFSNQGYSQYIFEGNYLNLSGAYIDVGYNDFTIEIFYLQKVVADVSFFFQIGTGESFLDQLFGILNYNGGISYVAGGSPTFLITSPAGNSWHHVAFERINGNFYLFVDGLSSQTIIDGSSFNLTTAVSSINIGGSNLFGTYGLNEVYCLNGGISNLRITKNVALYTSEFDPTSLILPLVADANTSVLLLPESESLKYTNSIDNNTFTCHNNPVTNQSVTFSAGPITYPAPPPVWYVSWTPINQTINWCYGYTSGDCNYSVSIPLFNETDFNLVRSFNITAIDSLSGLNFLPNLEAVSMSFDTATSFDITNNITSLTSVYLNGQYLTSINGLSTCTPLKELTINNTQLKNFNGNSLLNLTYLDLYQNNLSSVDVSQNVNLEYLNVGGQNNNDFTNISLSANTALKDLRINSNTGIGYISELNISQNVLLERIYAQYCNLGWYGINFSNNPNIKYVNLSNNGMTSSQVDAIINTIGGFSVYTGSLDLFNNSLRTSASDTAYNALISRYWTIYL